MKYKRRSFLLFSILIFFLIFILLYISYLQIFQTYFYTKKSIKNYTRIKKIYNLRGIITDRNNNPIATTKSVFSLIFIRPKKISMHEQSILTYIEKFYNQKIDIDNIIEKSPGEKTILKRDIPLEDISIFLEKFSHFPCIAIEESFKRNYIHKELFCHTIGYINKEKYGLFGLEKTFDTILLGKNGLTKKKVNSQGDTLTKTILESPEDGQTIKTTLDTKMQKLLLSVFPKNEKGSGIIINAETGEILALLSSPYFNPHIFQQSIEPNIWEQIKSTEALINRSFQALYPPGSIYKLLISLIMLEENFIDQNTQWNCNGNIIYKGRKYYCGNRAGHGKITIGEGISYSCNIPFYIESISHLSIDLINQYAKSFGFGAPTGAFINELSGTIPSTKWKQETFGEPWFTGETISISIGQGATTVTPLQICQFIMGIMYGYIIPPYIIPSEKKNIRPLSYKEENLKIIQQSMKVGSQKGSSKALSKLNNWEIYGKTSTVQIKARESLQKEDLHEKKNKNHGLFSCWAKYKSESPIILVFAIENIGGAQPAVKLTRNFFEKLEKEVYKN